ncbi:UMP-CMP kinase [Rhizophlyctis rosea]|nr:UMP-CMP kinase [Rhizophlyctis rosea]
MEDFYRELTHEEQVLAQRGEYNFDHPTAMDLPLLENTLQSILSGETVQTPRYDFHNHVRRPGPTIHTPDVVICSGIFMLYKKRVREAFNLKVFVDVDSDVRLSRQVVRDTEIRHHKTLEEVLSYYIKFVKPSFEDFIMPTKKFADVIIPRGDTNTVAIDLLTQHISDILKERALPPSPSLSPSPHSPLLSPEEVADVRYGSVVAAVEGMDSPGLELSRGRSGSGRIEGGRVEGGARGERERGGSLPR